MCWIRERKLRSSRCLFLCVPVCFLAKRRGSEIMCSSHIVSQYSPPAPLPKRTMYLCLKGRIWAAQAEAQGTSLHFMLASVFMCSQVVLLVSSQSGSCRVPRAPGTKTLWRVLSLLWRQNREQTFQTLLIFPHCCSHPVGSPSWLPSLFSRLPLIFLSLSLPLRLFLFHPQLQASRRALCDARRFLDQARTKLSSERRQRRRQIQEETKHLRREAERARGAAEKKVIGQLPSPPTRHPPTCTLGLPSASPFFFSFFSSLVRHSHIVVTL